MLLSSIPQVVFQTISSSWLNINLNQIKYFFKEEFFLFHLEILNRENFHLQFFFFSFLHFKSSMFRLVDLQIVCRYFECTSVQITKL